MTNKMQTIKTREASDIQQGLLIIEFVDEYEKLIFNMSLVESSGEIQLRIGNSETVKYLEINQFRQLLDEQEKRLRDWAEAVKD